MDADIDADLVEETRALLEPGDIDLNGLVFDTGLSGDRETELHQQTIAVGDVIAEHAGKGDHYVYSGSDDPRFGLNQHQGLTLEDDSFVWECQQLKRDGRFLVVFYYEADADHDAIVSALRDDGYDVTGVRGDA